MESEDDTQPGSDNANVLDGVIPSQSDADSEETETTLSEQASPPATYTKLAYPTVPGKTDDVARPVDESVGGCNVRPVEKTATMKMITQEFTDFRKELKNIQEPITKEIRKVGRSVRDVESTVAATYGEVCKANLAADIQMEQLTENDSYLPLFDRNGQEACLMADDFVKQEPIFMLNYQKDYRMRIRLLHKHQRDASNFRIKYVSVKPSDGLELGLKTIETRSPNEGSEVVALFQSDKFQSVRLSSPSPQFGTVQERYISLPIRIRVEIASHQSGSRSSDFEVNGQILCRLSAGINSMKLRRFERFALHSWKSSPQWMRDEAKGAIFVASMATD